MSKKQFSEFCLIGVFFFYNKVVIKINVLQMCIIVGIAVILLGRVSACCASCQLLIVRKTFENATVCCFVYFCFIFFVLVVVK